MVVVCLSSRKEFRGKPKGINSRTVLSAFFFLTSISDFSSTTGTSESTKLSLKSDMEGEEEEEMVEDEDEEVDRTVCSLSDTQVKNKPKLSDSVKTPSKERLPKICDKKTGDGEELFLQKPDSESRINLLQILQKQGNLR